MLTKVLLLFSVFILLLCIVSVPLYGRINELFEFDKSFQEKNAEDCQVFKGIRGAEDSAIITSEIVIFSSDDRMTLWETENGLKNVKQGGLFVFFTKSDDTISILELKLNNFPSDIAFHPHGIYVLNENESRKLFVINHAYDKGGERVDVFDVHLLNKDEIQDDGNPISLEYKFTIGNEYFTEFSNGVSNDIVVLKDGEFYITQYLAFPDSINGRHSDNFVSNMISKFGNLISSILGLPLANLRHCTYDSNSNDMNRNVFCEIVASGTSYNGINKNKNSDTLFVSDPIEREIHTFNLSKDFKRGRIIKLPYSVDNIELNEKEDTLYLSAIWGFTAHLQRIKSRSTSQSNPSFNPGGAMQLYFDSKSGSYTFRELVMQDGKALSSIAVACPFKENYILLGSWEDDGVLMCPRPK